MTKEQIMEILKTYDKSGSNYDSLVADEILALFEKPDAKNSLQQEMLDGYNQEPIPGVTE